MSHLPPATILAEASDAARAAVQEAARRPFLNPCCGYAIVAIDGRSRFGRVYGPRVRARTLGLDMGGCQEVEVYQAAMNAAAAVLNARGVKARVESWVD